MMVVVMMVVMVMVKVFDGVRFILSASRAYHLTLGHFLISSLSPSLPLSQHFDRELSGQLPLEYGLQRVRPARFGSSGDWYE